MDPIKFELFGLHLQEPMAILTNLLVSIFCFFAYYRLRNLTNEANYWWRLFFIIFGVSTVFGAMGHAFFYYFGIPGKFPCWIVGTIGNACAAKGMLSIISTVAPKKYASWLVVIKSIVLLALALITQKFIFIAIDAILTYLVYAGIFGWFLLRRGIIEMRFMVLGVIVSLPSAFIFILKINPHRWLNKDDLSHLLMLVTLYCFYRGLKAWGTPSVQITTNV